MSSAIVEKKFLPKLTKSCVGVGLYSSADDEIGNDLGILEREMKSLHNRLTQIESNTDQKLAALGQRLHSLTKTIDNLNFSCDTPKKPISSFSSSMESSVNRHSFCTSTPTSYPNTAFPSKPKWTSSMIYDRPRAGEDIDCRRPKVAMSNVVTTISSSVGEADRIRAELNLREKNLVQQEKELTSRKNHLLAKIKSLSSQAWSENLPTKLTVSKHSKSGENRLQWRDELPRSSLTEAVI